MKNRLLLYAGLLLLLVGLWYFRVIVMYFIVSVVLSLLGAPLVERLELLRIGKLRMPRWTAAACAVLLFVAVFFSLFLLVVPVIVEQVSAISQMEPGHIEKSFAKPLAQMRELALQLGLDPSVLEPAQIREQIINVFSVKQLTNTIQGLFGILGTVGAAVFVISFMTFFLLREKFLFYRFVHLVTPVKYEPAMQRILRSVKFMLGRYFVGIILQVLVYTAYIFIGMLLVGEKYAFTIALFAGIVNLIPYLGPWLGLGFALLLGVSTQLGADFYDVLVPHMVWVTVVVFIATVLDNFVSYPLIFSNTLRAHPLELFTVVLLGGKLGGIAGMVLAAPVYTVLRIIAGEFFTRFDVVRAATRDLDKR